MIEQKKEHIMIHLFSKESNKSSQQFYDVIGDKFLCVIHIQCHAFVFFDLIFLALINWVLNDEFLTC